MLPVTELRFWEQFLNKSLSQLLLEQCRLLTKPMYLACSIVSKWATGQISSSSLVGVACGRFHIIFTAMFHDLFNFLCSAESNFQRGEPYNAVEQTLRSLKPRLGSNTLFLFYKKPTTWRVGSTFLWKPRFKAQKFLKLMKISGFCFLTFYHFQPQSFLRCLKFEPEVSCDIKNLSLNFLKYSWLHYQAIEIT